MKWFTRIPGANQGAPRGPRQTDRDRDRQRQTETDTDRQTQIYRQTGTRVDEPGGPAGAAGATGIRVNHFIHRKLRPERGR